MSKTDPKNIFFQNFPFSGKYSTLKFWIQFCNFSKITWAKKIKISFFGSVFDPENMVTKFFRNSNFSDFLGIKSEISQWDRYKWKVLKSFESSKISQLITDFEISQKSDLTIGPIKQIMTGFKKAYDNTLSSQLRNFKKGTRLYLKRFFRKKNHVSKS